MKESFLHYIWQYQLYDKTDLITTSGEKIAVEKAGIFTQHSGPDFTNAKIRIDSQLWVGNVEIHLKSSDWYAHHHETDAAYENVILHVVWEDDMPIFRQNNTPISTLELKGKVSQYLLQKYQKLQVSPKKWIPCEEVISEVEPFVIEHWLERLYIERLQGKTEFIQELLQKTKHDWEAVLFILLARNFGLKYNSEVFYQMANTLDFNIVRKESNSIEHLEALFMGMLGMLDSQSQEPYEKELWELYAFQKHKYQLTEVPQKVQYFKLRPPNFPTIRLSQFARLWAEHKSLFDKIIHGESVDTFYNLFKTNTSAYWQTHYTFGKSTKFTLKNTTRSFIDLVLINTVLPLKFVYQNHIGKPNDEILLDIIQKIEPEKNTVVTRFQDLNITLNTALHSQAVLTLKNEYCDKQRCLQCQIGLKILNK